MVVQFETFCLQMFTQCKTALTYKKWKNTNIINLLSLYKDFKRETKGK